VTSFGETDAGMAVSEVMGTVSTPVSSLAFSTQGSSAEFGLLAHTDSDLDRDLYVYDTGTEAFVSYGASSSGNLEYHWTYDLDSKPAKFVVDYVTTIEANPPTSVTSVYEVPTALDATLTANNAVVGSASATFGYYQSGPCGTTTELTSFASDGVLGTTGDQLTFDVDYALTEGSADTISTTGDIDLVSGTHNAGVDWSVTARGAVDREDCVNYGFETTSGNVTLGAHADSSSVGLALNYSNVVLDETTGMSLDLNGTLMVNGQLALSFSGSLADSDSQVGENVTLTFAEGETMTLAAFLESQSATAALRALSFLR
jgi:hypothetical protein